MERRKNKLIITALLMVGLVGMIGTAAADNMVVDDSIPYNMVPGGPTVKVDIDITDIIAYGAHSITATVHPISGSDPNNVELYIVHPSVPSTSATALQTVTFSWTTDNTPNDKLELYIKSIPGTPAGQNYTISIVDLGLDPVTINAATIQGNTIPEFPTIALPIAAILGLMFIISSRKKEE